jgi:protocatechuate 3,4-dioxygenase beta subunit
LNPATVWRLALVTAAVAATSFAQAPLAPTPAQTEGPFYPRAIPADHDADLTQVAGRATSAQGIPLYFSGRVLARDGTPHAGAVVELWQCDAFGRYHHTGDRGEPRDDGFQGYGAVTTGADGGYAFKTIRPVPYGGRVGHLHVKLRTKGGAALTTQVYVKGDRADGDPVLRTSPEGAYELLTMPIVPARGREPGALAGTFDFVLP